MSKRPIPATHVRDSVLNVMMGFAGKDNFVTIPLTFAKFCDGDLIIAALFSQILYWTGVTDDPEGWIAKSYEDWHEELSLTRSQVDRSVKALEKIGLQTDKRRSRYHDFAPTIHYRFDKEVLSAAANAFFADPINGKQKMKGKHVSNLPKIKQKHLLNISKSQSLNISESEMLDNSESYRETMEGSIEESINTYAPAIADAPVLPSQTDTSSVQGAEKSARTDKAPKAEKKAQDILPPDPHSAAPLPPKEKSILAWIIDDVWANRQGARTDAHGVWKRLLPVLVGNSKKADNVEPPATECEIVAFGRWYRYYNPQTALPMDAKVASWFGQFRLASDYERRVRSVEKEVAILYHGEAIAPKPDTNPSSTVSQADIDAALKRADDLFTQMQGRA